VRRGGEKQFSPGPQVFSGPEATIGIPAINADLALIADLSLMDVSVG
jgi:hypothetical protein